MEFRLVPNESENGKYDLISVWFNKNQKVISLIASSAKVTNFFCAGFDNVQNNFIQNFLIEYKDTPICVDLEPIHTIDILTCNNIKLNILLITPSPPLSKCFFITREATHKEIFSESC